MTVARTFLTSSQTIKSEDGPRHDIHQVSRGCTTTGGPDSCTLQVNSNGTVMEKRCHHTCLGMAQNSESKLLTGIPYTFMVLLVDVKKYFLNHAKATIAIILIKKSSFHCFLYSQFLFCNKQ